MKRLGGSSEGVAKKRPFLSGLVDAVRDSTRHDFSDEQIVIIKDQYPKARHHYLLLPKKTIANLAALKKDDTELVKHMLQKAKDHTEALCDDKVPFRYGFHSIPSMSQLHLHAISQDFDSPCLKTKKHWNSFTSPFFLDAKKVIEDLESNGKVLVDSKKASDYLKQDLRCHVCGQNQKNMPVLKKHLTTCSKGQLK